MPVDSTHPFHARVTGIKVMMQTDTTFRSRSDSTSDSLAAQAR